MKLFKPKLLLATFLALFAVAVCMASVKASGPTETTVTWNDAQTINVKVIAGDDGTVTVIASGLDLSGAGACDGVLYVKDANDNPYNYQVDTITAYLTADIVDQTTGFATGTISFTTTRDDSWESMYGNAGEVSTSRASCLFGSAEINFMTWTNYAKMGNGQYALRLITSEWEENLRANGITWSLYHSIVDGDPNDDGAFVAANGLIGSGEIKLMGEEAGDSWFNMGCLPVCGDGEAWDNNYAKFKGTGWGTFHVHAEGDNGLFVHEGGISIPGGGTEFTEAVYDLNINYMGTFAFPDFGIKGS